ncbi:hypothetical protein NKH18_15365 [Streptomyces sp. M10(2022)]
MDVTRPQNGVRREPATGAARRSGTVALSEHTGGDLVVVDTTCGPAASLGSTVVRVVAPGPVPCPPARTASAAFRPRRARTLSDDPANRARPKATSAPPAAQYGDRTDRRPRSPGMTIHHNRPAPRPARPPGPRATRRSAPTARPPRRAGTPTSTRPTTTGGSPSPASPGDRGYPREARW